MRALITGASAGIGEALARHCAMKNHDLILVARRKARLEALAYELNAEWGVEVDVFDCDLGEADAARELFARTEEAGLQVDLLINNAGLGQSGDLAEMDLDRITMMMRVNIEALTQLTRLYLPAMIARGEGRVLNVGSVAGFPPGPGMAVYYATKAYVYSLTEALVEELKGTGVTITNLAPGATDTEFQSRADIEKSLLFAVGVLDAEAVAKYGYEAMMRGKALAIPGLSNKLSARTIPLVPRRLIRKITRRINSDA